VFYENLLSFNDMAMIFKGFALEKRITKVSDKDGPDAFLAFEEKWEASPALFEVGIGIEANEAFFFSRIGIICCTFRMYAVDLF